MVWYYEETRATRKRSESKFELASGNAKPDSWIRPPSGISCTSFVRVVMFGFLPCSKWVSQPALGIIVFVKTARAFVLSGQPTLTF